MKKKGFTLVELIGVIVLIAILSGIAVVGYIQITKHIRNTYYKGVEESMLLAGGEYYAYNKEKQPIMFGREVETTLEELVNGGYIEGVLDKNKQACNNVKSKVIAYKNSYDKTEYGVCLICEEDDYESNPGCNGIGIYSLKLTATIGNTSKRYKEGTWTNQDIKLKFETLNDITSVTGTGITGALPLDEVKGIKTNQVTIGTSGEYKYIGHGESGKETEEKSINVLIDKIPPTFSIEETGVNKKITITLTEDNSVIKNKIQNIEDTGSGIKQVLYSFEKEGKPDKFREGNIVNNEVELEKELTGGIWKLKVEVHDNAGNKKTDVITYEINDVFTITLNKQNGTGGTEAIYEKYGKGWYSNKETTTSINKIITPTRDEYTFEGYYTEINGKGTEIIDKNGNIIVGNTEFKENKTIYAKWNACTYTVKYNGNGETSGTTASSSHRIGVAKALTENGYTRAFDVTFNYNGGTGKESNKNATATFNGWAKTASGAVAYTDKQSVTNLTTTCGGNVALYAKWTDGSITLPTPDDRTGYTFDGWYSDKALTNFVGKGGAIYTPKGNATLYAKWTANIYPINYVLNGGTQATTGVPTSYTYGEGAVINGTPTKDGYKFTGWTNSLTSQTAYSFTLGTISTGERTFTANWQAETYPINYELNGGTQATTGVPTSYTYGEEKKINGTPTKDGYTFDGWTNSKTSQTSTQFTLYPGTMGERTFTANWKAETYPINYVLNGGTQATTGVPTSYTYGEKKIINGTPTKNGYTFDGWTNSLTSHTSTQFILYPGTTGERTFTANWKAETYPINYVLNGGTQATTGVPTSYTYGVGAVINGTPTKDGYKFTGWTNSLSSQTSTQFTLGTTSTGERTFTANWKAETYPINYVLNGGTQATTGVPTSYTYGVGAVINGTPTKSGYTFTGWTNSLNSQKSYSFTLGTTSTGERTFTANWCEGGSTTPTYTVTYNKNGATSGTTASSSHRIGVAKALTENGYTRAFDVTFNYNGGSGTDKSRTAIATFNGWAKTASGAVAYTDKQSVTNLTTTCGGNVALYAKWTDGSITLPKPEKRNCYTFQGWYSDKALTNFVGKGGASYTPTGNVTLYAKWLENTYTVTYKANGGSGADQVQNVTYNSNWTTKGAVFSRTGYTMDGWSTSTSGSKVYDLNENAGIYKTCGNMTLYAHWESCTYTVTYNGNGATGGTTGSSTHKVGVERALTANRYKREFTVTYNYNGTTEEDEKASDTATSTFNGWAKTASGTVAYNDKDKVTNLTTTCDGNVTLYAKWTDNTVTLPTPTKTGYTFDGWYSDKALTKFVGNGGKSYKPTEDVTLNAKWTPNTYKITLDNQGGTGGTTTIYEKYADGWYSDSGATTSITTVTVPEKSETVSGGTSSGTTSGGFVSGVVPGTNPGITYPGLTNTYNFKGYYTEKDGNGTQVINEKGKIVGSNQLFTSNTTLFAKWQLRVTPSISFDLSSKTSKNGASVTVTCTSSDGISSFTVDSTSVVSSSTTSTSKSKKIDLSPTSQTVKATCKSNSDVSVSDSEKYSWSSSASSCGRTPVTYSGHCYCYPTDSTLSKKDAACSSSVTSCSSYCSGWFSYKGSCNKDGGDAKTCWH